MPIFTCSFSSIVFPHVAHFFAQPVIANMQKFAVSQEEGLEAEDLKEVDAELAGESPMYADTEFVESDAFQVVSDDQVDA